MSFRGASVKRTSDYASGPNNNDVPWQSAEYDTDQVWDPASPHLFTIPPGWDGQMVRLTLSGIWPGSGGGLSGYAELKIFKNGDKFNPVGISQDAVAAGNTAPGPCVTRPLFVSAGDTFTAAFRSHVTSTVLAANDYSPRFSIELLGAPTVPPTPPDPPGDPMPTILDDFDDNTPPAVSGADTIEAGSILSIRPTVAVPITQITPILWPHPLAVGEAVELYVTSVVANQTSAPIIGPLVADDAGNSVWHAAQLYTDNRIWSYVCAGTLTANGISGGAGLNSKGAGLWLRLRRSAPSVYQASISVDNLSFVDLGSVTGTGSPTQAGFGFNGPAGGVTFAADWVRTL